MTATLLVGQQLSSALLTPLIAIMVAYIAYRQWRTAHDKFMLDMFDRRLAIHAAARDLIASVVTSGRVDSCRLISFADGTRPARWLLDPEVERYLYDDMYKSALELQSLRSEETCVSGDNLTKNVQKQGELTKWISEQHNVLDSKFIKFLRIQPMSRF